MTTALDIRRNTIKRYNNPQAYYINSTPGFIGYGGLKGSLVSTLATKNGVVTVGTPGRQSWADSNGSPLQPGRLLNRRFHRVNLSLSAPTPGEEDLHKHWNKNRKSSGKSRTQSAAHQRVSHNQQCAYENPQNERPNTTQTPCRAVMYTPPATPNDSTSYLKNSQRFGYVNVTPETGSTKDPSPPASPQTSSSLYVNNRTISLKNREISPTRSRANTPSNCNRSDLESKLRTTTVRPMSANRRTRNRSPNHILAAPSDRRWSFSETKGAKDDDDSAYSSSRDVNTDKGHVSPIAMRKSRINCSIKTPPSSPGNKIEPKNKTVSFKEDRGRVEGQQLRRMGGATAFYYPNEKITKPLKTIPDRPYTAQKLPSAKLPNPPQPRPQTQPAITISRQFTNQDETSTTRNLSNTRSHTVLKQCVDAKYFPLSLADYEMLRQHNQSLKKCEKFDFSSRYWNPHLNPETGKRILSWLSSVEENPSVYYGFETDFVPV